MDPVVIQATEENERKRPRGQEARPHIESLKANH